MSVAGIVTWCLNEKKTYLVLFDTTQGDESHSAQTMSHLSITSLYLLRKLCIHYCVNRNIVTEVIFKAKKLSIMRNKTIY